MPTASSRPSAMSIRSTRTSGISSMRRWPIKPCSACSSATTACSSSGSRPPISSSKSVRSSRAAPRIRAAIEMRMVSARAACSRTPAATWASATVGARACRCSPLRHATASLPISISQIMTCSTASMATAAPGSPTSSGKYAPNGNSVYTNLKLQAEYLRRHEQGEVTYDAGEAFGPARASTFDATQSGWYLQAVYQFRPYWRIGLRHDRLDSGSVDYGANNAVLPRVDIEHTRNTMMLDYSPSEFSRIRLQYARDEARQGVVDDQFFLQYQMSIGAHGAHQF